MSQGNLQSIHIQLIKLIKLFFRSYLSSYGYSGKTQQEMKRCHPPRFALDPRSINSPRSTIRRTDWAGWAIRCNSSSMAAWPRS